MITIRPAAERGRTDIGWLDSWHTFSFGDYHDSDHQAFRSLRVINDDRIAGGSGFGMHGHRDMEIITWLLAGTLEHRDSLGNGDVLRPGDVQTMSAGTGIMHSERNPSADEPIHLLQCWVLPDRRGGAPTYAQRHLPIAERRDRWAVLAAGGDGDGGLPIRADARVLTTVLAAGKELAFDLRRARHAWLHVATGAVDVAGHRLGAGDAAAISDQPAFTVAATTDSELLLFDLA